MLTGPKEEEEEKTLSTVNIVTDAKFQTHKQDSQSTNLSSSMCAKPHNNI
jgi:hypothetical protein